MCMFTYMFVRKPHYLLEMIQIVEQVMLQQSVPAGGIADGPTCTVLMYRETGSLQGFDIPGCSFDCGYNTGWYGNIGSSLVSMGPHHLVRPTCTCGSSGCLRWSMLHSTQGRQ